MSAFRFRRIVGGLVAVLAFAALGILQALGQAPADQPQRLASFQLDPRAGSFTARFPGNEKFTRGIRLEMKEGSLRISRVIVLFEDGQVHIEERPINLLRGERTRPIGSPDQVGIVRQLEIEFEQQSGGPVVNLDVVGNSATAAAAPAGALPAANDTQSASRPAPPQTQGAATKSEAQPSAAQTLTIIVNHQVAALIRRVRVSLDGKLLALGDDTGTVRILNFQRFEVLRTIKAHEGRILDMDFSSDSRVLVTGGDDRTIRFWDPNTGSQTRSEITLTSGRPFSVRFNTFSQNKYLLMGDGAGRLMAWNLDRNQIITDAPRMHARIIYDVGYQPSGKGTFFSAGADGFVRVRTPSGRRWAFDALHGAIRVAGYSPNGNIMYTAGADRRVRLWDARNDSATMIAEIEGNLKYILAAHVSYDGRLIASGGGDKAVNVHDVESRKLVARLRGHADDIEALTFTPDNRFIVSSSEDRSMKIWSVEGRELLFTMYFDAKGSSYVGLTTESQYFGDRKTPLLSVYKEGKLLRGDALVQGLEYLGSSISIVPNG